MRHVAFILVRTPFQKQRMTSPPQICLLICNYRIQITTGLRLFRMRSTRSHWSRCESSPAQWALKQTQHKAMMTAYHYSVHFFVSGDKSLCTATGFSVCKYVGDSLSRIASWGAAAPARATPRRHSQRGGCGVAPVMLCMRRSPTPPTNNSATPTTPTSPEPYFVIQATSIHKCEPISLSLLRQILVLHLSGFSLLPNSFVSSSFFVGKLKQKVKHDTSLH